MQAGEVLRKIFELYSQFYFRTLPKLKLALNKIRELCSKNFGSGGA